MQTARRWSALFVLVLALLFGASEALAQSTGGSFGGGSFGRSGSSGSSGSGSSGGGSWGGGSSSGSSSRWGGGSSSGSYGNGGYDSSRDYGAGASGGGGGGCFGGICCLLMFGGIVVLAVLGAQKKKAAGAVAGAPSAPAAYYGPDAMHVSRLSIGVDWRARRELQDTLKRLAQTGDTTSPQGLANLLRETVLSLRRAELSWLYIGHEATQPLSPQNAEAQFGQIAMRARSAFRAELVRGAGGQVHTQDAAAMQAGKNEGDGTVVVHLIIASYRAVQQLSNPDANQIRGALDNRAGLTAQELGALEVVWSPAAENDRMSSAELEQFYPDLRLIDPNSIAGRLFCTFCRGPFAMELLSCPHCGAPAEASQANRAPPGA